MDIEPFAIERYFAKHEFSARYLLSASDCEGLPMRELIENSPSPVRDMWNHLKLNYTESQGHPILRELIASLYPGLRSRNILVAAPEELIYITMRSLLQPGDHVVVLAPCYQSLVSVARAAGCDVDLWHLSEQNGKWGLDLKDLANKLTNKTRLVVVNFPNNPTGYLPTEPQFKELIRMVESNGSLLFCDEMYRFLEPEGIDRLPSASTLSSEAIALCGLSKSFALPGLRLGWLACQDENLINRLLVYKDYTTICNSAPSEILAMMALHKSAQILSRNLQLIRRNTELSRVTFEKFPHLVRWIAPSAGSVAFPAWVGNGNLGNLVEQWVAERGLMVVPGEYFQVPNDHFRVGLGRENYSQSLEVLADILRNL